MVVVDGNLSREKGVEMWKSHGQHTSWSLTVSVIRLEAGDSRDPEL